MNVRGIGYGVTCALACPFQNAAISVVLRILHGTLLGEVRGKSPGLVVKPTGFNWSGRQLEKLGTQHQEPVLYALPFSPIDVIAESQIII